MASRGRKSAASLAIAKTTIKTRPDPPESLTEFQKAEWIAITNRMPADWFARESHSMLTQLCRHIETASVIATAVEKYTADMLLDPDGVDAFDKLTKLAEREGRAASSLARALRLTQQSRYHPSTAGIAAKSAGSAPKPWEIDD